MISEGETVTFIATSSGITDKKQLMYLWEKNGQSRFSDRISGHKSAMLTISNLMDDDEGTVFLYCNK